jgi:Protein of unknown function (DUF3102)
MITVPRTLVNVQRELSVALQHNTRDMLKIGSLLNEAKTFVEHGEWLPWLRRHTALTKRSAQNYMKAAAWADALDLKNAGAALFEPDLDHLSLEAIILLASGKFSAEIVEQVLAAAATRQRHIGEADVREIAKAGANAAILQGIEADQKAEAEAEAARLLSLAKAKGFDTWEAACEAWEAAQQAEEAEAERKQAEVEAILDRGPDPNLPPASETVVASSEAFHVATFEKAIDMLRSVETKPASMFGSAKISPNDIEQITAFLQEVAKQIAEKRRAG